MQVYDIMMRMFHCDEGDKKTGLNMPLLYLSVFRRLRRRPQVLLQLGQSQLRIFFSDVYTWIVIELSCKSRQTNSQTYFHAPGIFSFNRFPLCSPRILTAHVSSSSNDPSSPKPHYAQHPTYLQTSDFPSSSLPPSRSPSQHARQSS